MTVAEKVQKEILVPNIGDSVSVEVIEVLVRPGDHVSKESSLLALESDKATMEIPSPYAGIVTELKVQLGDTVSEGSVIALIELDVGADEGADESNDVEAARKDAPTPAGRSVLEDRQPTAAAIAVSPPPVPDVSMGEPSTATEVAHASPAVRRLARELGIDLAQVQPTGRKARVLKEDIQNFVKSLGSRSGSAPGLAVSPAPQIDFSQFGPTTVEPLNKIRKVSAANLHRSWVTVPHVTQFDEADITDLEAFRQSLKPEAERRGVKVSLLPLIMKACVATLKEFPRVNASLDSAGDSLILKAYFHVGVAVDTPQGLVVPVVRDVDKKGVFEIAAELTELSAKARDRKLRPADMQGASFTVSSLGGIGGTFFTPIINNPEVAILGVSRSAWKPVYRGDELVRCLVVPLSLSYDHRVIDGADGVRFTTRLGQFLTDLRRVIL